METLKVNKKAKLYWGLPQIIKIMKLKRHGQRHIL
jgi:hypothetical protein